MTFRSRSAVGRFCAKCVKMRQAEWEVVMLRKAVHSACCSSTHYSTHMQLPRRNDGVECRAFCRFGRRACPETPRIRGLRACPKTPHRSCGAIANHLSDSAPIGTIAVGHVNLQLPALFVMSLAT